MRLLRKIKTWLNKLSARTSFILSFICLMLALLGYFLHHTTQPHAPKPAPKKPIDKLLVFKHTIAQQALQAGAKASIIKHYLFPAKLHLQQKQISNSLQHKKVLPPNFNNYWHGVKLNCSQHQLLKHYQKYATALQHIHNQYGIPPGYLLGIWCTESRFGKEIGNQPLISSLLTLAYAKKNRSKFFAQQLIDALVVLSKLPYITPKQLRSTFDGGMGQTQLEPSSYLSFAVKYTPPGPAEKQHNSHSFSDVWNNPLDALTSTANYLEQSQWNKKQPCWGLQSKLPSHVKWRPLVSQKIYLPIRLWEKMGLKVEGHSHCAKQPLRLVKADKLNAIFLVYRNFDSLLLWNNSIPEALAIGLLHDQLQHQLFLHYKNSKPHHSHTSKKKSHRLTPTHQQKRKYEHQHGHENKHEHEHRHEHERKHHNNAIKRHD